MSDKMTPLSSSTTEISSSLNTSSSTHEIVPIPEDTPNPNHSSSLDNSTQFSAIHNENPDNETANTLPIANRKPKSVENNTTIAAAVTTTTDNTGNSSVHDEKQAISNLIAADIRYIKQASEKLGKYRDHVISQLEEALMKLDTLKQSGSLNDYRELKKNVTKLKLKIPSKHEDDSEENDSHRNQQSNFAAKTKIAIDAELLDKMPHLYKSTTFEKSPTFQDFEARYNELTLELKLCLLCFSVFPENVIIKKRLLAYWWIAEGFTFRLPRSEGTDGKMEEDYANEFFDKLVEMGFIEPVYKKRGHIVDRCKMHPSIRSVVVMLAERAKFFDFNQKGNPSEDFSSSYRACLVGKGLINIAELEKLHMLFNVNEGFLEFKPEWFFKMKNVNILYLGRWQASAAHHIEVEETKFLDGLENMKYLRFFSLQGVSRITELPNSISKLMNLKILDLRSCYNLEVIPDGIGSLKSLTHFDMSECYLLDRMPKELSLLSELQVLKGFVVGVSQSKHSCSINDLAKLPKLKKLSIYTGLKEFPSESQLKDFQRFPKLFKLTIAWGRGSLQNKTDKSSKRVKDAAKSAAPNLENRADHTPPTAAKSPARKYLKRAPAFNRGMAPALPSRLEKLDLQCFPGTFAPNWLKPCNLVSVKRLYIRGGKLCDLGRFQELNDGGIVTPLKKDWWAVERLRLKYLTELEMDWRELQDLFPKLVYLEKVKCPKLTLFPCDESGVWINRTKK